MTNPTRRLLTVAEVCDLLKISDKTCRVLVAEGKLAKRYIGTGKRYYRITGESFDDYYDSLSSEPLEAS